MSDVKRYEHMSDGMGRWFINPTTGKLAPYGEYVLHSDYARLKAEVERLRKAGDAMQDRLGCKCGWLLCKGCQEAENNWEKAKEGKQP